MSYLDDLRTSFAEQQKKIDEQDKAEAAKQAASAKANEAKDAASTVTDKLKDAGSSIKDAASNAKDAVSAKASEVKDKASELAHDAKAKLADANTPVQKPAVFEVPSVTPLDDSHVEHILVSGIPGVGTLDTHHA